MKCLIIQSDGEHKGQDGWTPNWHLRECYAIQYAFIKNGWQADVWGKRHNNFNMIPDFNSYDIIFCIENYEFEWIPDLSNLKPLKIQWIIDLHCQKQEAYYEISNSCDIILHSTKSLIEDYSKSIKNKKHIWFPNGVDDKYFYNRNINKTIDISFTGSKNQSRKEFVKNLEKDVNLKYFFATGIDMINNISCSKIHFNKNISCDINYRIFETIGLGTCLITDYNPELYLLGFIDEKNCLIYKTYDEAIEKIKNALFNNTWVSIAKNGEILSKEHFYSKKIKHLLKEI